MAQHGSDANPVLPELPATPQSDQGAAQMAAVMAQLASLQAEIQSLKAQNAKLRMRKFCKLLDEDDLEYDAEDAGAAAASAAAPAAPAMPASFAMTPDKRGETVAWTQQGWVDWGASAPPPQQPPGFVDPWYEAARTLEKSADEAAWAARGWIDRSKTTQMREPWCAPAQWRGGWQQCAPAQWQHDGWQHDGWGAWLQDLQRTDIEKPEK